MRKKEKVLKRISEDKEICKRLKLESYYDAEQFVKDGFRYIKAIKEGRVINCVGSVSSSGMSRMMKFLECAKSKHHKNKYMYLNFIGFMNAMGNKCDRNGFFRIHGSGMDMVFHTNYTIIHKLHRLGFVNKAECKSLAQDTPTTI